MTNWRKQRWICYVLVLIMAVTGTSVCAFAAPNEDVENDAPEVVANELNTFDEAEDTDGTEAAEDTVQAAEAANIEVNGVIDEETNSCTISWTAVEGADKYVITYGDIIEELSVEALSFVINDYDGETVTVQAFLGEELLAEGTYPDVPLLASDESFAKPELEQKIMPIYNDIKLKSVQYPSGDRGTKSKGTPYPTVVDKPITITWEAYPGAASYNIERMSSEAYSNNQSEWDYNGQWWTIAEGVTETKYIDNTRTAAIDPNGKKEKNTDLLAGVYTYRIVPVDADGNAFTDVNGEVVKSEEAVSKAIPNFLFTGSYKNLIWHIKAKKTTKLYKKRSGSAAKLTVPKGTKGVIKTRRPYRSKVEITLKNGEKYVGWMIRKQIGPDIWNERYDAAYNRTKAQYRCAEITNRDYTQSEKERYANNFTSKTKYFIWISRYTQKINIFYSPTKGKKNDWKLVRVCECSTGNYLNYTGTMTKTTYQHKKIQYRSSYWYKNLTRFWKENSMHAPCYLKKDGTLKKTPSDKTSTLGCVRTWPSDAEFIYKLPLKTKVRVYY